jgi:hypothetical protein
MLERAPACSKGGTHPCTLRRCHCVPHHQLALSRGAAGLAALGGASQQASADPLTAAPPARRQVGSLIVLLPVPVELVYQLLRVRLTACGPA